MVYHCLESDFTLTWKELASSLDQLIVHLNKYHMLGKSSIENHFLTAKHQVDAFQKKRKTPQTLLYKRNCCETLPLKPVSPLHHNLGQIKARKCSYPLELFSQMTSNTYSSLQALKISIDILLFPGQPLSLPSVASSCEGSEFNRLGFPLPSPPHEYQGIFFLLTLMCNEVRRSEQN